MQSPETRELRLTRTIKAPLDLVWEVWTTPKHIVNWWGPAGFTSTIYRMDFSKGGEWNMTLHGPDGTNFPNKSIFMEIIPSQKIVFEHFHPHFITTVEFSGKGKETTIGWSLLFDTADMFNIIVKAHKADEGQKQNLDKLEQYLMELLRGKGAK
jgi:uncharacterized protein YndB with AHSA1/START domain